MRMNPDQSKWWTSLPPSETVRVILCGESESLDQNPAVTRAILHQLSLLPNSETILESANTTELNALIGVELTPEEIEVLYKTGLIRAVINSPQKA